MQANAAQPTQSAGLFTRPADADVVLGRIPTHTCAVHHPHHPQQQQQQQQLTCASRPSSGATGEQIAFSQCDLHAGAASAYMYRLTGRYRPTEHCHAPSTTTRYLPCVHFRLRTAHFS